MFALPINTTILAALAHRADRPELTTKTATRKTAKAV